MEHEAGQPDQDSDRFGHRDEVAMGGLTHSISQGVRCPATVLVVAMSTGSYLLVKYPEGEPVALVTAEDAGLLRQGLEQAFGHPQARLGNRNDSGSKPGRHENEP